MRADVFAFGVFPFVLWGAIRFEAAGAAIVSSLTSAIAVWGTAHGFGPFIKGNALQNATLLQSFLGVTSISGIILAAVIAERAQLIREQSALEALERSEKSYRGIVETAYEGIWKVDTDFITSFVNCRMADLLGYTVEEILGRPLFDFLFESDTEQQRSELQRRRRGLSEQLETRYRKKDGSVLWARVATSPIIGEDGAFEGTLAMISDMTEQKRSEAEECRSRGTIDLLSRAVEQTAESVVITDRQGTIQYASAGHVPGFLMNGSSKIDRVLKSSGPPLGLFHDSHFVTSAIPLTPQQVVILLTDGAPERRPRKTCSSAPTEFSNTCVPIGKIQRANSRKASTVPLGALQVTTLNKTMSQMSL